MSKRKEIKNGQVICLIIFVILVVAGFAFLIHLNIKEYARRQEEIRSVKEANRVYEKENAEFLIFLVYEMADCQRQDEKAYEKNRCNQRGEEARKKFEQAEQHRIEINYRIEKLWPKVARRP